MIPQTLEEWTLESLTKILENGCFESDRFDFKEKLPDSRNNDDKIRHVDGVCAFSNTDFGGFLVYGVRDQRMQGLVVSERIVGIPRNDDLPERFGASLSPLEPGVEWAFKNPPIPLPSGNVVHVVQIFPSKRRPIGRENKGDGSFRFMKRTNKGNEAMSYDEVRLNFLGYYEKRLKLSLLVSELKLISETASGLKIPDAEISKSVSILTFNTSVVDSLLSDVFSLIAREHELLSILNRLRADCSCLNNSIRIMHSRAVLPLNNLEKLTEDHNKAVSSFIPRILSLCDLAMERIKPFLLEA